MRDRKVVDLDEMGDGKNFGWDGGEKITIRTYCLEKYRSSIKIEGKIKK